MAHSLALFEDEDVICVSDRENAKIDCMKAGLRWPVEGPADRDETGVAVITYTGVGRTYAIAAKGNKQNPFIPLEEGSARESIRTIVLVLHANVYNLDILDFI